MELHIGVPEVLVSLILIGQMTAGIAEDYRKLFDTNKSRFVRLVIIQMLVTLSWFSLLYWGGFYK